MHLMPCECVLDNSSNAALASPVLNKKLLMVDKRESEARARARVARSEMMSEIVCLKCDRVYCKRGRRDETVEESLTRQLLSTPEEIIFVLGKMTKTVDRVFVHRVTFASTLVATA